MAEQKKINWLLILQAWAMVWVIIGHAYLGEHNGGPAWETLLGNIAYSFHMPLFMLVSGWLFYLTRLRFFAYKPNRGGQDTNKWTWTVIINDKAIRLLLPGLVFSVLAFSLKIVFPGEMSRQAGLSFSEIAHAYLYPYDNPFRELWFIATLFVFFLLTPLWKAMLQQKWVMWVGVAAFIVLYFIHPETQFLCIDRVCKFAIWFYLGLVVSKEDIVDKYIMKLPWVVIILGIALYLGGRYTTSFITTIGGIFFSIGFALTADNYMPKLFFSFRNYTYQIFLMGIFAQMFVKILFKHISMPYVGAYVLCVLMGIYVPVLVSKIIEKINWKPLSLCVGLKTR